MATTSQSHSVKSLNTSAGRRRFVFKTFSQRVEEIDINVYRSLDPVKAQPSDGSSFLRESLVYWRELNTAEDFISFYEKMMPLVQTLPQVILHKETIISELLDRLNMKARLSLEPILMLIAALSRDLLDEFLPLLQRLVDSLVDLLKNGGHHDPEILEQVFTSWSYIMMYLQKYLVRDVVSVLKITAKIRFFPKDYVQEFMAEAVSFLLRNSCKSELSKGVRKVIKEVAKSSSLKRTGVTALLCHVMRGASLKLHSRAETVWQLLIDKSIFRIVEKYFEGPSALLEVSTGVIGRLCSEIDHKDLRVIFQCLFKAIFYCISDGYLGHLNHLLSLLAFAVCHIDGSKVYDGEQMLDVVNSLVEIFVVPSNGVKLEDMSSKVLSGVLELMLCLLDVPLISADLSRILLLYAPIFKLKSLSLLGFIRGLILKDSQIVHVFRSHILSTLDDLIEASPQEVLFLLLTFFERHSKDKTYDMLGGVSEDEVQKICNFFKETILHGINLFSERAGSSDQSNKQISVSQMAVLWAVVSCYPCFLFLQDNLMLIKDLIETIDLLLETEADKIADFPKSTWQSIIGAALGSYHKLLLVKKLEPSEASTFLHLAKRHKSSLQVLSSVAEYMDSIFRSKEEGASHCNIFQGVDVQDVIESMTTFGNNLNLPNKAVRLSTLRILSHYAPLAETLPTTEVRPHKKLKTEESGANTEISQSINVIEPLLSVEMTPLCISTSRKIVVLLSKLHMNLSSGRISDIYIPLLLNGIIGILHNRFSPVWESALECLTILIGRYKELAWNSFVHYLDNSQSKFLCSDNHLIKLSSENHRPNDLVECFNLFMDPDFDCTPCTTVLVLLLQSLQKIPDIAESRSRQLIPLFLKFLGYGVDDCFSAESYAGYSCKRMDWKMILKEWLNLLARMCNARSLYRSPVLKEVLLKRLLDEVDPDIQLKVLDCLLNWKDDFMISYDKHLKNLIATKSLREELTTWAVSGESECIQERHRCHLIPIIIRLLTPKVRKLKLLGSRKHTGVSHRKAVLYFLAQLEVHELELFFVLLLKPLIPKDLANEFFDVKNDESAQVFIDGSESCILVKCSSLINIANLSWKKKNGFLHVVDEILGTFDESHIKPYLNPLLMIVVRILENCMLNLANEKINKVGGLGDSSSSNLEKITAVPDASLITAKQLKDLRSLCLKVISIVLNKYESYAFGSDFWDIFFFSVKPLIDSFKYEGSSSEKPSSLLSCFVSMSSSSMLVSLLEREANLVPTIFSILTVRTASDAIISSVLNFIENLLNLDTSEDHLENGSLKRILAPNLDVLIQSFHGLLQSRKEVHRKSTKWPGNTELRIFKLLVRYIIDPSVAWQFVDILLPFFKKKGINPDEALEGLHVMKGILPVVGFESSGKILEAIHPLLVSAGLELRLSICDIVDGLVSVDPSLAAVARPLHELNAVSSSVTSELDYDTRMKAYDSIAPELFAQLKVEHALLILSHCVYDMASEELIFRQSASRALLSFIDFAAPVLNKSENYSSEVLLDVVQKDSANQAVKKEDIAREWTKTCIKQIVNTTFLHNIGDAMTKDVSVQKGWIEVLRNMVYHFEGLPSLNLFRSLCSKDPEVDFFNNILHLQIHRRRRALSRFREILGSGNLAENIIIKIFLPLFFNMLIDVRDGKGEDLRNASLETIASISGHMRWESYRSLLMRCFKEMIRKPDKQKILVRLICAILDKFHFSNMDNSEVMKNGDEESTVVDTDVEATNVLPSIESNAKISYGIQGYLQNILLPQIQKLLTSDTEKVNVNISLAAVKVLKLLPVEIMDSQLSSIVHHICIFLKNRLESIRDDARSALAACVKELGLEYLQFVVKVLQSILKRGYELHVLGYTLNFMLSKTLGNSAVGKLDYCLGELLSVVENDILGDVAEEKEVDKIASKMKETRKKKSFETLKLISQSITFRTHAMKLLSPINSQLLKHITPRMKVRLEMMLQHIALGIECNPSVQPSELFVFVYGLIEDSIGTEGTHCNGISSNGTNKKSGHELSHKRDSSNHSRLQSHNSHLIVVFALGLLHSRLKNMKLNKEDEQLLSMLDPFVRLLRNCLSSKYEDVLAIAFRCLTPLVRIPLPSLQAHADDIKIFLLEIAQKSGNVVSPLVQSCLKLLTVLLRSTKISLSNDQLHMLIQFPVFIDLQTKPSPIALSLLKSIIDRKLVVHEMYDIVVQVAELMVTSQLEPIRKKSSQVLLQFLLDYRLSDKRLQQHMDFLLANLSYEHSSGREAVLEMLHAVLVKFPKSVIDNQAQSFFLHLVVALANEHDHKVRAMVATAIKVLLAQMSQHAMQPILGYTLSWYMGEKQHLWSASAEVLGLLVEAMAKDFQEHVNSILQVTRSILESSIHAASNDGLEILKEAAIPLWKEAYYSLTMLEKMLSKFSELYFETSLKEIWMLVCKLLLHPHLWVRNISSRLVSSYFISVTKASSTDKQRLKSGAYFLVNPSRLFAIAVSCLNQLKNHLIDDTTSNLITQNLVFSACGLHSRLTNTLVPHEYWSTLDSCEKGVYLEAFELLGSKKARNTFLFASTARSDSETNDQADEDNADVRSLLIVPLIKRMGKIAMQMEDMQMRIVFNSFRMISLQIGSQGSHAYAIHMLDPLYKVCEGFAGKVVSDEIKQLAEEVRDNLRDILGVENFVNFYNLIRKNLKQRRDKRSQQKKLIAVINPMRHAKRKLRVAEKHRAHKKRKIMAMKMARGKR